MSCSACGAPIEASRFARSVDCPFCRATVFIDEDAVPRARFRRAHGEWDDPARQGHDTTDCVRVAGRWWQLRRRIARGRTCDVHEATLAREPTERVVLKTARPEASDGPFRLNREQRMLEKLAASPASGADHFATRVPAVVAKGVIESGPREILARRALLLGWSSGFVHTFEHVREAFPTGVEAHHAPWLWRRILEALSFAHRSGVAHGAVSPEHLLVHPREHGVLPVGWGDSKDATPEAVAADLRASARAVGYLLDGSETPQSVAGLLIEVSKKPDAHGDAWALREKVGEVARGAFGPPRFMPFAMPGWD